MRKLGILLALGLSTVLTACSSESKVELKDDTMTKMIEGYSPMYKPEVYDFVTWDDKGISDKHEFLGSDLYFIQGDYTMTGFMFFKSESDLESFMTKLPKYVAQVSAEGYAGGELPDWYGIRDNAGKYGGVSQVQELSEGYYAYSFFTFDICEYGDDNLLFTEGYIDTGCILRITYHNDWDIEIRVLLGNDFEGVYQYGGINFMTEWADPYMEECIYNGKSLSYCPGRPSDRKAEVKCVWEKGKFKLYCTDIDS